MKSLSLLVLENDFTCCPNHIVLDVMVTWKRLFFTPANQISMRSQIENNYTESLRALESAAVPHAAQWEEVSEGKAVKTTNSKSREKVKIIIFWLRVVNNWSAKVSAQ